jgi:hypothetical protein
MTKVLPDNPFEDKKNIRGQFFLIENYTVWPKNLVSFCKVKVEKL